MENYQHRPLDTGTSEIRLVRIEKNPDSDATDPVKLTLRHAFLDGTEKFTTFNALSYAWGDDPASHEVVVYDGQSTGKLLVRNNLHDFLRVVERCADEWSSQWIFIDQICIDQNHLKEKCHQVGQMGKLYSSALATIVWSQSEPISPRDPERSGWEDTLFEDQEMETACKRARLREMNAARVNAIKECFKRQTVGSTYDYLLRSYWWRAWVLQEIVLAPKVCILMPDGLWTIEDLSWMAFILMHHFMIPTTFRTLGESSLLSKAVKLHSRLDQIRLVRRQRSLEPMHEIHRDLESRPRTFSLRGWEFILLLADGTLSTCPFDRVYGMMGLVGEDLRFDVDYDLTPVDLLVRILQFYWRSKSSTEIINMIIGGWFQIFETILTQSGFYFNHLKDNAFKEGLWRAVEDYVKAKPGAALEEYLDCQESGNSSIMISRRAVSL